MLHVPRGKRPALHAEPLPKLLGFQENPQSTSTGGDTRIHLHMAAAGSDESTRPAFPVSKGLKRTPSNPFMKARPNMSKRPEDPKRVDSFMNQVAVVDREKYEALVTECNFLLSAYLRRRVGTLIVAFVFATTTALAGFWGGFAAGQQINQESFKALCSQVVDQAIKNFQRNTITKSNRLSAEHPPSR